MRCKAIMGEQKMGLSKSRVTWKDDLMMQFPRGAEEN